MIKITIRFAGQSLEKTFTSPITVGQILGQSSIKAVLGYDNVEAQIRGVAVDNSTYANNGDTINLVTKACSKAA